MSVPVGLGAYREGYQQCQDDLTPLISNLLDEVYRLRAALAYEAAVVEAHTHLKTFPKSRRQRAADQVERMRAASRGEARRSYASDKVLFESLLSALRMAGADSSLTRGQFEAETLGRVVPISPEATSEASTEGDD